MKTYLVGGQLEIAFLNLETKDLDYIVCGSTEEQMTSGKISLFYLVTLNSSSSHLPRICSTYYSYKTVYT